MFKSFSIAALLSSAVQGFKYDDLQPGRCPFKPGEIQTADFDQKQLVGSWINVFDRNMLNDHLKCYSARFTDFYLNRNFESEDQKPTYFEYSTVSIDNTPKEKPTVRMGMQVNFNFHDSNSVGMVDHSAINPNGAQDRRDHNHLAYLKDPTTFDPWLWDSQFQRYIQILDTDDQHYIVLYQCFESANFKDNKNGNKLDAKAAFKNSKREYFDFKRRPIVEYSYNEDAMEVEPIHFQNIKILWKGKEEKSSSFDKNIIYPDDPVTAPTEEKIEALKKKITQKMPSEFPKEVLDNAYARLEHPDYECEYNSLRVLDKQRYVLESYGHRGDVEAMDGFYSKDVDYAEMYNEL